MLIRFTSSQYRIINETLKIRSPSMCQLLGKVSSGQARSKHFWIFCVQYKYLFNSILKCNPPNLGENISVLLIIVFKKKITHTKSKIIFTAMYSNALNFIALHYTLCTILYCTVLHCTELQYNVLYCRRLEQELVDRQSSSRSSRPYTVFLITDF